MISSSQTNLSIKITNRLKNYHLSFKKIIIIIITNLNNNKLFNKKSNFLPKNSLIINKNSKRTKIFITKMKILIKINSFKDKMINIYQINMNLKDLLKKNLLSLTDLLNRYFIDLLII
jgi:hypothetical protein